VTMAGWYHVIWSEDVDVDMDRLQKTAYMLSTMIGGFGSIYVIAYCNIMVLSNDDLCKSSQGDFVLKSCHYHPTSHNANRKLAPSHVFTNTESRNYIL
jgi:hypothetical protein